MVRHIRYPVNRGTRLYRRFRDFFSKMDRGRILLLGIIACVMLSRNIYSTLHSSISTWYLPDASWIQAFIDSLPELLAYITALLLVLYVVFSVRGKMRDEGETMTLEHLRELAFIAFALALLALPATFIWVSWSLQDFIDPNPWELEYNRVQRLFAALGMVAVLITYSTIAYLSWRAYRRESADADHRLERGRVLTLSLIALIMLSSDAIYYFGWVRYYQIIDLDHEVGWYWLVRSPYWFSYYALLSCIMLAWLVYTRYRMRSEGTSTTPGQFQELAVISIGLWLIFLPHFIDQSWYFIERYIIDDPPDIDDSLWIAYETQWIYYRLGLLYTFLAYLIVGLLALKDYRMTSPIDVVPLEEPALPPHSSMPADQFHPKD